MKIENKIIQTLNYSELEGFNSFIISNCIIETIDFDSFDADMEIVIENCIITNFCIHSAWFTNGLVFRRNIVVNYVNYQMGGHNEKPIVFVENIFHEFVNFFDCHFNDSLILENNIFNLGSNLIGNNTEGFANTFVKDFVASNNVGEINLNGVVASYK